MSEVALIPFEGLKAKGIRYCRDHVHRLEGDGKFPKHVKLSAKRFAWIESELDAWVAARIASRGN